MVNKMDMPTLSKEKRKTMRTFRKSKTKLMACKFQIWGVTKYGMIKQLRVNKDAKGTFPRSCDLTEKET